MQGGITDAQDVLVDLFGHGALLLGGAGDLGVHVIDRAEQIMSRDIRTVGPDTTVMQAIRLFRHHHVKTLPVVDSEGVVQGIISLSDLLAQLDLPMGRILPTRINLWCQQQPNTDPPQQFKSEPLTLGSIH